jgi:peptidoglycan/LPS O-acetylase OafA/YrhL
MSSQTLPFRLGQRPCLDGLRGVAVLSVVAAHLGWIPGGVVGVDVLFVLSGFLITVLLVEEWETKGAISLGAFYRKRFLRILPPLGVLLVVGGLVEIFRGLGTLSSVVREASLVLAFMSNWPTIHMTPMPTYGHTWTLSLEVQFYLLWPVILVLLLAARVRRRYILALLVIGILASAGLRLGLFTLLPIPEGQRRAYAMRLFMGLDTHADPVLAGCLAGLVVAWGLVPQTDRFRRLLRITGHLGLGGMAYMVMRCHHEQFIYYYGLSLVLALLAANHLVWWMTVPPRLLWLFERPALRGLGRISFALYLFHIPLIQLLRPADRALGQATTSLLIVALSLASAILSFYLIERPVLSLRYASRQLDTPSRPISARAA